MAQGKAKHPELIPLTMREQTFTRTYFTTGDRLTAYKQAGYKIEGVKPAYLTTYCGALVRRPKIQRELSRLKADAEQKASDRAEFTLAWLRAEHQKVIDECRAAGDMTNLTRNLEALGRTMGAYSDTLTLDAGKIKQYTDAERIEARRIAALMLVDQARDQAQLPVIDVESTDKASSKPDESRPDPDTGPDPRDYDEPFAAPPDQREPLDPVSACIEPALDAGQSYETEERQGGEPPRPAGVCVIVPPLLNI